MTATAATNNRWARPPKVIDTDIDTNQSARNTAQSANSISNPLESFSDPIDIFFSVEQGEFFLIGPGAHIQHGLQGGE